MVLQVQCSGTPYETAPLIKSSIAFYTGMFKKAADMEWPAVRTLAAEFEANIKAKWPALLEEMQGIADAAELELADIIALNVRTEIAFGLFSDGCTALAWKTPETLFLAQNWDWLDDQRDNLICLTIAQPGLPTLKTMTEAGQLGKIGINSAGVGVCCNAIRAHGMDPTRLPMHLALRTALQAPSLDAAVATLSKYGVAASCHILLGDRVRAVGMEWSHIGHRDLALDPATGRLYHANHLLLDQAGVVDSNWLPDSAVRVARIEVLADALAAKEPTPTVPALQALFADETSPPAAICRLQTPTSESSTLFNIVMDLAAVRADVIIGRPSAPEGTMVLSF